MIIIYTAATCVEAIKPRQIINYDAGIVLIDLHQLNVKTTSDNTNQRHWIRGNLMSTKNRTRRTTTRNASAFLTKWLNKLISLLSKRVREFLSLGHWSLPSEITSERERAYTSIKSDEEYEHPVLPSEQDDIVNSLNYGHCSNLSLQFYHFLTVTDCVGSVTD